MISIGRGCRPYINRCSTPLLCVTNERFISHYQGILDSEIGTFTTRTRSFFPQIIAIASNILGTLKCPCRIRESTNNFTIAFEPRSNITFRAPFLARGQVTIGRPRDYSSSMIQVTIIPRRSQNGMIFILSMVRTRKSSIHIICRCIYKISRNFCIPVRVLIRSKIHVFHARRHIINVITICGTISS